MKPPAKLKILVVGGGKMGSALIGGWYRQKTKSDIKLIETNAILRDSMVTRCNIKAYASLASLNSRYRPDIILFAVKPDALSSVLTEYKPLVQSSNAKIISIAAGKTIKFFRHYLGENASIIRAMPNTPALVGKGYTGLFAEKDVGHDWCVAIQNLFDAVGDSGWVPDESKLHDITAISGSGPAYVFYFLEALKEAAISLGMHRELASELALSTLYGSALLALDTQENFETLRRNVTSPNGTTAAAIKVLEEQNVFKKLIKETAWAAAARSRELSE